MGYIKEPDGIDFIINGKPLTDEEAKGISEFWKNWRFCSLYQTTTRWSIERAKLSKLIKAEEW